VVVAVTPVPTKFVEYRIEREKVRSQRLDLLERMLESPELDAEERRQLQLELISLLDNMAKETELENLLKVNGYIDAVVLIENDSATIVVPVTLTSTEVEAIGEMVRRITNIRFDRITIIDELTRS
jgi:stage III sporulation protein AH